MIDGNKDWIHTLWFADNGVDYNFMAVLKRNGQEWQFCYRTNSYDGPSFAPEDNKKKFYYCKVPEDRVQPALDTGNKMLDLFKHQWPDSRTWVLTCQCGGPELLEILRAQEFFHVVDPVTGEEREA